MTRWLLICAAVAGSARFVRAVEPVEDVLRRVDAQTDELRRLQVRLEEAGSGRGRRVVPIRSSRNFLLVTTAGGDVARRLLEQAESSRRVLSLRWLGEELSTGRPVLIHAELGAENSGRASLEADDLARVWIAATDEATLISTLEHELTHVVFRARFPDGLPAWANEGAASLCDDPRRQATRRRIVRRWVETGEWPSLKALLRKETVAAGDLESYAASATLASWLVERRGHAGFVRCVEVGLAEGWEFAFASAYGIRDWGELERGWQRRAAEGSQPLRPAHPSGAEKKAAGPRRLTGLASGGWPIQGK